MARRVLVPTLLVAVLLGVRGLALAQPAEPPDSAPQSEDTDQRLEGRQRPGDRPQVEGEPQADDDKDGVRFSFDGRPTFDVGRAFHLEFGGRVNADVRGGGVGDPDDGTLDWSGRRLEIAGRVMKRVGFELSHELGKDRPWRDAFVDVEAARAFGARAGQFKVPFSADRLRGLGKLDFVHRSLVARVLAPGRDQGAMAFGEVGREAVSYEIGIFRGELREIGADEDVIVRQQTSRPLSAGRVVTRPFVGWKDAPLALRSLRLGGAVARGWNVSGFTTVDARTLGGNDRIIEPVFVSGPRTGFDVEARWSPGPFLISAEWMDVREERRGQALEGGDLSDYIGRGWYVSGVWRVVRLRGRDHSWVREALFRELEIVARVERIAFGTGSSDQNVVIHPRSETIPWQALRAVTIGATWRLNRYGRILVNAVAERPDTTWLGGPPSSTRWSGITRLQLQF